MTTRFSARICHLLAALAVLWCSSAVGSAAHAADTLRYVIHVSVDGLRADAVQRLGAGAAPHFHRLRVEGAYTENARTDFDYTVTLPNHACELTSRPVLGPGGHGLGVNSDDGGTLEQIHGSYVAGVFDVVHDNGLTTGMYANKSKFAIFDRSWCDTTGAMDTVDVDNGRDKIDIYRYHSSSEALVSELLSDMSVAPFRYTFLHLADPDGAGHSYGWEGDEYFASVVKIDGLIGRIFDTVDSDERLTGRTYLIVTADHGGTSTDHSNPADPANYTVPLYVWGPGIPAGADLYRLNVATRLNPGGGRPDYASSPQPIRNGETANLALDILGLPAVCGSSIDASQDCDAMLPGGVSALPAVSITNPAPGTILPYPSGVVIEASVDPGNGVVERVEFFENYAYLGSDSTSPYLCAWDEIPFGVYALSARGVRDDGIAATASVNFEISTPTGVEEGHSRHGEHPPALYPNPVDGISTVAFSLSSSGGVDIAIYDLLGRRVGTVFSGRLGRGTHELVFDATAHSPGVYFLRLSSPDGVHVGKFMVVP